jgi:hypothetical protein
MVVTALIIGLFGNFVRRDTDFVGKSSRPFLEIKNGILRLSFSLPLPRSFQFFDNRKFLYSREHKVYGQSHL